MIKSLYSTTLLFLVLLSLANKAMSQGVADTSKGKRLDIIDAARYNFQKIKEVDFVSLVGNVKLKQDRTYFFCDSAVLNQTANTIEAFGNIHINDADSVQTYSQYL